MQVPPYRAQRRQQLTSIYFRTLSCVEYDRLFNAKKESHEKNQEMPLLQQGVQHTERGEKVLLHGMCRSRQAGDKEEKEHPPQ